MCKFILFTVVFFGLFIQVIDASEKIKSPSITYLDFNKHTYLCFNGKQYIHDPDCPCAIKYSGTFTDSKGKELRLNLYRSNFDLYID